MPGISRKKRYDRRRRTRVASRVNDLTDVQWTELVSAWGSCAYCDGTDTQFQKDCVQPISRGGRYTFRNVVPACRSCNASKCNFEVTSWLRRKRYDEKRFLERFVSINIGGTTEE
ncbi:HNH endonuclease [Smaragdicoccus niigatensis]|uniref:HNH endonuclease n=1 Tax=Smaragdicoccus niigatensis TaxID=359359 RepID=UPI0003739743|nr:HNH endonuclease [Smaragdicoccus niigatensis]